MPPAEIRIDSGATAWVLASTALVLLMTPGLAFFYGGMVRAKNILAIAMQNFVTMALVGVTWVLAGFSLAFGRGTPVIGDLSYVGLTGLGSSLPGFTGPHQLIIPPIVYAGFQMMFAIVAAALITGATADRWRFGAFVPFMIAWTLLAYAPAAHWLFSPTGWAAKQGALDFAGGSVVHINAGAAALAMALVLGRRHGWPDQPMRPHNLPMTMLGAGLLWFGWIGFNAGSALRADNVAGYALVNTFTAAACALLAWIGVERIRYGKATSLGAASGVVAGLVAVTPAAGYVTPIGAAVIGITAGAACALAVTFKMWFGLDDALDVVAVHLGGGLIGSLSVGLFATTAINPAGGNGVFYGGGYRLLGWQAAAAGAVAVLSFCVAGLAGGLIGRIVGNRVPARTEDIGLDLAVHGESAYEGGALPAIETFAPGLASDAEGFPDGDSRAGPPSPDGTGVRAAEHSGAVR
ncbi:MAG: ammonium transporter [Actinomycetia bacterium]|jgi:Amt family ammonium transporter|nr:ammonium transporter [Actinomycetes bacterium]